MDEDSKEENAQEIILEKNNEITIPQKESKLKYYIIFYTLIIFLLAVVVTFILLLFLLRGEDNTLKEEEEEKIEILPPLVFNSTSGNHTHTLIFIPGFSNTPENFINILTNKIKFSKKNDTTIIILRSPYVEVTVTNAKNYSWFDIYNFPIRNHSDYNFKELKKSAKILEKVINNEVNILQGKYENIIIGGHSQGGSIALYHGYHTDKNLGGLFIFSGILPPGKINQNKNELKTYYGYGDEDDKINPDFLVECIERIKNFKGFQLYLYPGHKHHVCTNETKDASKFLDNIIK